MDKVIKPPQFRGKERYNPLKGFNELKKKKAKAKAEMKRARMLKVGIAQFYILKAKRSTSQLAQAGDTFNEIATQFQNLSLSLVDPETEPANLNITQAQAQAQVQVQVQVYE